MRRLVAILGAVVVAALLIAPAVIAADANIQHDGRVLVSTGGDVTVPAGDHVDALVVIDGTATIAGEVNTIVVVEGRAVLDGARTETIVAVRSPVELRGGSVVLGDVMTLDSQVAQASGAVVDGRIRDLAPDVVGFGLFVASMAMLLYIGYVLASVVAGVLLAGIAASQVRSATALIRREPVQTVVAGLLGLIVPVLLGAILMVTVVGVPLAFGIWFGVWPMVGFLGYLVAGIAIGDWILGRTSPATVRERPYLAAAIGVLAMAVLTVIPLVGAIAAFLGFGAVVLAAWRTLVGGASLAARMAEPVPAS